MSIGYENAKSYLIRKLSMKLIRNIIIVLICVFIVNISLSILQPQLDISLFKHQLDGNQVFYQFVKLNYYNGGIRPYFNTFIFIGLLLYIIKSVYNIYKLKNKED